MKKRVQYGHNAANPASLLSVVGVCTCMQLKLWELCLC
jgi:hypothetical protein